MKKFLRTPWTYVAIGIICGLVVGCIATRWHYKTLYKNYVPCTGSINYYDKTGKTLLYSDSACGR